jgi:hypothetical protein
MLETKHIIKTSQLLCFLIFSSITAWSQAPRLKYAGIESGINFIACQMIDNENVRGDVPAYDEYGFETNSLTTLSYKSFFGVKGEIFALNDRLSLSSGLRFSQIVNSVGKNSYWGSGTDYFYWLSSENGTTTNYLRVKQINQKSEYIGIPVEVRGFIARRPHFAQLFLKLGIETDVCLHTKNTVEFANNAMQSHEGELKSQIKDPNTFFAAFYGGGGIRIGRETKPSVSIEGCFPYLLFSPTSLGLVEGSFGGGFQVNVQIPLIPKKP